MLFRSVDSNPPHITHWLYTKFEMGDVPKGWEKFQQPAAVYWDDPTQSWQLNPDAENLRFLPDGYYQQQLDSAEDTYIRVMLANEYGASRKGRPIFTLYSKARHVAKAKLDPDRQWPLIVGLDFGLNPGCVIGQLTRRGIRITDDIPTSDESLEDFLETYLVPLLAKRYAGYPVTVAGDPAGRGRSPNDKRTSFDILGQFGLKGFPAYTNSFQVRKETVDHFLRRDEGLIISPHCTNLREAMATGYVWKESRNNKGASLDIADKNEFSHVCFTTGTLVDTPSGRRPIETLRAGDEVCGPFGSQRVEAVGSKYAPKVIVLDVGGRFTVSCTPEHPFAIDGEWVQASAIPPGQALAQRAWLTTKSSRAFGSTGCTTDGATMLRRRKSRACLAGISIAAYGRPLTDLYHRAMLFTIGTMIRATTTWVIWSVCQQGIMQGCISLSLLGASGSVAEKSWQRFDPSPRLGMPAQRVLSGTGSTGKNPGWIDRLRRWYAQSAEKLIRVRSVRSSEAFAQLHAKVRLVGDREWMTRQEFALAVERATRTIGTARGAPASLVLQRTSAREGQIVHSLKVSGTGTFYVHGLHVSNCDALQYLALWAKYGYRPQPIKDHGPKKKTMMV